MDKLTTDIGDKKFVAYCQSNDEHQVHFLLAVSKTCSRNAICGEKNPFELPVNQLSMESAYVACSVDPHQLSMESTKPACVAMPLSIRTTQNNEMQVVLRSAVLVVLWVANVVFLRNSVGKSSARCISDFFFAPSLKL